MIIKLDGFYKTEVKKKKRRKRERERGRGREREKWVAFFVYGGN